MLAGHDSGRARLAYLGEERARQGPGAAAGARPRARRRHPGAGRATDPRRSPGRASSPPTCCGVRFVLGIAAGRGVRRAGRHPAVDRGGRRSDPRSLPIFAATLLATGRQISAEWEFQLAEAPDGLRLRSGLLQTRAETFRTAGSRRSAGSSRCGGGRSGGCGWSSTWRGAATRTARSASRVGGHARPAAGGVTRGGAVAARPGVPGAVAELPDARRAPTPRARWRAPLSRRYLRCGGDGAYLTCCTGRLRPSTRSIVPLEKVQSIRWSQGRGRAGSGWPASAVDTAGQRFTGEARFRDEAEAHAMLWALPDQARSARRRAAAPHG